MVTIYALKDNGKIFYIGQTISIIDRMYQHKAERRLKKTKKQQRIKDIFDNGRELSYEILGTCETQDGLNVEKYYIKIYLAMGCKLVNTIPDLSAMSKQRKPIDTEMNKKEKTILQLMADDLDTNDIAKVLSLSTRTIEQMRNRIKKKAKVKSIAALMYYAYKNKLVS